MKSRKHIFTTDFIVSDYVKETASLQNTSESLVLHTLLNIAIHNPVVINQLKNELTNQERR